MVQGGRGAHRARVEARGVGAAHLRARGCGGGGAAERQGHSGAQLRAAGKGVEGGRVIIWDGCMNESRLH